MGMLPKGAPVTQARDSDLNATSSPCLNERCLQRHRRHASKKRPRRAALPEAPPARMRYHLVSATPRQSFGACCWSPAPPVSGVSSNRNDWLADSSLKYSDLPSTSMFLEAFKSALSSKPQFLHLNAEPCLLFLSMYPHIEHFCDVCFGFTCSTILPASSALYSMSFCSSAGDHEPSIFLNLLPLPFCFIRAGFNASSAYASWR